MRVGSVCRRHEAFVRHRDDAPPEGVRVGQLAVGVDDDKRKPAHAVPVASARPDQNPKEMASQSGPEGPWPTGARWRVQLAVGVG